MSTTDRNYSEKDQTGVDLSAKRVGDITGQPSTNEVTDRNNAAKMANLLEGLQFPSTKQKIMDHLNKKSSDIDNKVSHLLEAIENNLSDGVEYDSAYEVERAIGLVEQSDNSNIKNKPLVRDRALNIANNKRIGEEIRRDPYTGRENIGPANERNVSPNTPKGEDV
jgi:hypothetical protein